jgi:hypothetical protein
MISSKINFKTFEKDMANIIGYSIGFLDGAKAGKVNFFKNLADITIDAMKDFIDSNARVNPEALHHVYEWYRTGSPDARLFDIEYIINGRGISLNSTFRQSSSVKEGSTVPFYNKARVMEDGLPVKIKPKRAKVLAFEDETGKTVFSKNNIVVLNPGGNVSGEYEKTFNLFMTMYFKQSFLLDSRVSSYLKNPLAFKKNFRMAKSGGRSKGRSVGYQWISKAGNE